MRISISFARLALVAGAAFAVSACGSRPAATNVTTNAANVANTLTTPMNDASAMEQVSNAAVAPTASNVANSAVTDMPPPPPPSGNSSVQSNVAGM